GAAEPSRRVDPRGEPEADRALVAGRRVDVRDSHQRAQPRFLRLREPPEPDERKRAVLVDERDDVGDGGERDDVEGAAEEGMARAEERLRELPDDARPTEPG